MDWFQLAMGALSGLALFLLGIEFLAQGARAVAGERLKRFIARFTTNPLAGVGTGFIACAALNSSSVTIIVVIAMIAGGLMSFAQALGVVMGANIWTTVSSQVIAFEIYKYAPIALAAGLILRLGGKSVTGRSLGSVALGFGLLFLGLDELGDAVAPIADDAAWIDWLASLGERPLTGMLAGGVLTLIIQSSSATVGTAIVLAAEGLIPLEAGVAIMLGAEIGTVSDTLIATLGRTREAVRTAVFHLFYSVVTAALGLVAIEPLTELARWLTPDGTTARHIANAHVAFNVIGVALFLPFIGPISRSLLRLVPPPLPHAATTRRRVRSRSGFRGGYADLTGTSRRSHIRALNFRLGVEALKYRQRKHPFAWLFSIGGHALVVPVGVTASLLAGPENPPPPPVRILMRAPAAAEPPPPPPPPAAEPEAPPPEPQAPPPPSAGPEMLDTAPAAMSLDQFLQAGFAPQSPGVVGGIQSSVTRELLEKPTPPPPAASGGHQSRGQDPGTRAPSRRGPDVSTSGGGRQDRWPGRGRAPGGNRRLGRARGRAPVDIRHLRATSSSGHAGTTIRALDPGRAVASVQGRRHREIPTGLRGKAAARSRSPRA